MDIQPFELERYFARYEFSSSILMSASDCERLTLVEVLSMADSRSLALWEKLELSYTESQGHPVLREEIARLYQTVAPDNILVAAPEECIFLAMQTLLAPGDEVIVTFPGYQSLYELANAIGCRVIRWRLTPGHGQWELDPDFLRQQITSNTKLLVVNIPHNPTGYLPTREMWAEIIAIAEQHELIVFSDEMYRQLEHHPWSSLAPACDLYDGAISLFGLSKTYSLPGLRIGWLATRCDSVLQKMAELKDYTTICNSAPSEILGIIALRAREQIVQRNLEIIQSNLQITREVLRRHPDFFTWLEPQAGSTCFPMLDESLSGEHFADTLREQAGVMVVPGGLFEYPRHFRIGLGRKNLPEALEKMESSLEKLAPGGQRVNRPC
ncbi:MAG: aminotransferase class I/II-fold pyridoxal phosphate-dependent enzyme [Anaerolineales bacterium]|nr:aminotransferase class I/II-fold pyridoxal phosphate-dependent enzyme [Anaerolineales bacterium]